MQLISNDFSDGDYLAFEHVLAEEFGFGCEGGNRSPHLAWSGAPEGTQSYAVSCYDPGAGSWELAYDGSAQHAGWPSSDLDAVAATPRCRTQAFLQRHRDLIEQRRSVPQGSRAPRCGCSAGGYAKTLPNG